MHWLVRPWATILVFVLLAAQATAQDRPQVIAVNHPLQYFAERLLGDAADVVFPVPNDEDPSFWRPSVADITTIQSADLILLNGAGFATWIDRVSLPRSKLVNTSAAIQDQFIVTESITHSHGDGGEHSHEGLASYIWLDPTLAAAQAEAVATAIKRRDLAPAQEVDARLAALQADLMALDTDASTGLKAIENVPMIATHPRYQYFARRYDLSIASLEWEAGALPTDEELAQLAALAENTGASLIIWEGDPPESAIAAAAEIGLSSVTFPPLSHQRGDEDFLSAFAASVSALADAVD
ncbi:MAG: metal ABC transporter substrate-binding protein [Pseudomonadota bacterium]